MKSVRRKARVPGRKVVMHAATSSGPTDLASRAVPHPGGGVVEAIPELTAGREAQGRFLFSATVELF